MELNSSKLVQYIIYSTVNGDAIQNSIYRVVNAYDLSNI